MSKQRWIPSTHTVELAHGRLRRLVMICAWLCCLGVGSRTSAQDSAAIDARDSDMEALEAPAAPDATAAPSALEAAPALEAPAAPDATAAPQPSRVDASAPLSGGERWVKENGRWRLQRINYRYLDHEDYAPKPAPPPTIDSFPEPPSTGVVLSSRWLGSGWGWRATPYVGWGFGNGWGGWGVYARSPWAWGVSPWSPGGYWGYGGWRGVPRYGWGGRHHFGPRSRFGFRFGMGFGF